MPRVRWRSATRRARALATALAIASLLAGLASWTAARAASPDADEVDERLRTRLEAASVGGSLVAYGERVHALASIRRFYERRRFALAWHDNGRPTPSARDLLGAVRRCAAEGLRPADYHVAALEKMLARPDREARAPGAAVDLDLLLTDAFLVLGSHYLSGRLDPETIDTEWFVSRRSGDLVAELEAALAEGRVAVRLDGLLPRQPGYDRLRRALAAHRALVADGGWPRVPDGPKLEPGAEGERVAALRARLLGPAAGSDATFDEDLAAAVRRFQERHGLDADGVVGPRTLEALNVSAADRARQIAVNMERFRWMPQELGERHVLVNIAAFGLVLRDAAAAPLAMKVIVGRDYRRTPVFSGSMTHLVLNPHWEVPYSIATKDILPQIRKDPGYLAKQGMAVLQGWGASERRIDPASVDWSSMTRARFPYRLRQSPGPKNALGRIKFMFPNRFNVYLHDTPGRELFDRAERAFSSGCIRVERPVELTERLLSDDPTWSRERIERGLDAGREQTVWLPKPVPVHLLYWTAWIDDAGVLHVRRDLYGRDRPVAEALREDPPPPGDFAGGDPIVHGG